MPLFFMAALTTYYKCSDLKHRHVSSYSSVSQKSTVTGLRQAGSLCRL